MDGPYSKEDDHMDNFLFQISLDYSNAEQFSEGLRKPHHTLLPALTAKENSNHLLAPEDQSEPNEGIFHSP